jgi:hypothetical protein
MHAHAHAHKHAGARMDSPVSLSAAGAPPAASITSSTSCLFFGAPAPATCSLSLSAPLACSWPQQSASWAADGSPCECPCPCACAHAAWCARRGCRRPSATPHGCEHTLAHGACLQAWGRRSPPCQVKPNPRPEPLTVLTSSAHASVALSTTSARLCRAMPGPALRP